MRIFKTEKEKKYLIGVIQKRLFTNNFYASLKPEMVKPAHECLYPQHPKIRNVVAYDSIV